MDFNGMKSDRVSDIKESRLSQECIICRLPPKTMKPMKKRLKQILEEKINLIDDLNESISDFEVSIETSIANHDQRGNRDFLQQAKQEILNKKMQDLIKRRDEGMFLPYKSILELAVTLIVM
jgi:hypothetical protein